MKYRYLIMLPVLMVIMVSFTYSGNNVTVTTKPTTQDFDLAASIKRGNALYQANCVACHMAQGEGIPSVYPPLAKSDKLTDDAFLVNGIKNGISGPIKVNGVDYNAMMTGVNLNDKEIADVLNYIRNSWGNKHKAITPKEVAKHLDKKE